MKSILEHLHTLRRQALKHDLTRLTWQLYVGLLTLLILAVLLEGVLYLAPSIRTGVWRSFGLGGSLAILGGLVYLVLIYRNRIARYRWSTLALKVGQRAFTKPDTVLNALQLERSRSPSSSADLSQAYIESVSRTLSRLNTNALFSSDSLCRWRNITFGLLLTTLLFLVVTWQWSGAALHRWTHPRTTFQAPLPFKIESLTGNIHLLGGASTELRFMTRGATPDSLYLELRSRQLPTATDTVKTLATAPDSLGTYAFSLTEVDRDYRYRGYYSARHFWQAWREVSTPVYSISVTDRPIMETFTIKIVPPPYSGLPVEVQEANLASVKGLKGSLVEVDLTSNRRLRTCTLTFNRTIIPVSVNQYRANGRFTIEEEGQFTVTLEDERGITNQNPIPYRVEVLPDFPPDLRVIQPPPIVALGSDLLIPLQLQIEDDYGFSNLQVGYELQRPTYIQAEPFISIFTIPIPDPKQLSQELVSLWDLSDLNLMPEDEVHYHFELYDNDNISGPKKYLSDTFVARLPSLADLYRAMESQQGAVLDKVTATREEVTSLRQQIEETKLDLMKAEERLDWEQEQGVKDLVEKARKEIEALQEIVDQLEALQQASEKHALFDEDLLAKFRELSKLVEETFSPEILKKLSAVEEALENMEVKDLLQAVKDLAENVDQIEADLDRFIDIFKRIRAEQSLEEINKRLEQLLKQQDHLKEQIPAVDAESSRADLSRLSEEERRLGEEFSALQKTMEQAEDALQPFNPQIAKELAELAQSDLTERIEMMLKQIAQQLQQGKTGAARQSSQQALEDLEALQESVMELQRQFQEQSVAEMAARFRSLLRKVLTLSKSQEGLGSVTEQLPRNSSRLTQIASSQQVLQDQLRQIMSAAMDLSRETFAVTPELGRAMGRAYAQMEQAKEKLAQRNSQGAQRNQKGAMTALNEAAQVVLQSIRQMQSSGSASGFEQFLQRMQEMAGQQQGINSRSWQLALGQMTVAARSGLLQRLLQEQQQVRKSLQELLQEMRSSGKQGMGDLSGIAQGMDEVLKDFQAGNVTRKTVKRQERILSRMLDSQRSLTQRGMQEKRTSRTAVQVVTPGPAGLPADLGQRQDLALEALNRALKSGYPRDYQEMIRRYFHTLSQEFNPATYTPGIPTPDTVNTEVWP